jgi:hypothetical protein
MKAYCHGLSVERELEKSDYQMEKAKKVNHDQPFIAWDEWRPPD